MRPVSTHTNHYEKAWLCPVGRKVSAWRTLGISECHFNCSGEPVKWCAPMSLLPMADLIAVAVFTYGMTCKACATAILSRYARRPVLVHSVHR